MTRLPPPSGACAPRSTSKGSAVHRPLSSIRRAAFALLTGLFLAAGAAISTPAAPARAASAAPPALTTADADAWLDGLLPAALEREGIAGAVVSIVGGGAVVTERGYGWADTGASGGEPVPVDPERTLFRIGSISKLVTATVAMQLVEDGRLDLDDPVQDHLDFRLPVAFERPITMRHLLSHTAGFEDRIAGVIAGPDGVATTLRDSVAIDPPEQVFEPGTVPSYSNYSNGLAAYVVERITGRTFEDVVAEEVFGPAGMTTATLAQPLPAGAAVARGYRFAQARDEVPFEIVAPAPAGAISATAADMSAFLVAQLAEDSPLLGRDSRERMQEPALGESLGGLSAGPRMTLGWFEQDRNGHRVLGHGGDLTAFHAQLDLLPEDGAGIFVSLNSTGLRPDSTVAIRDALSRGFVDRYFPDGGSAPTVTSTASEHAEAIAGAYQVSRRSESTFLRLFAALSPVEIARAGEDAVTVSALTDTSGTPIELVEVEPWVWQEVGGQRRIAVEQQDGTVTAIGLNPAFALQPMPALRAALPEIAGLSVVVLLLALLATPVLALVRRRRGVRSKRSRSEGVAGAFVLLSLVALLAAGALWSAVASALLSDGVPPSALILRSAQALTGLAALGAVPALLLVVVRLRAVGGSPRRGRAVLVAGGHLVLAAAFCGLAVTAVAGGLLAPSISY